MEAALAGLEAYQSADRQAPPAPPPAAAQRGRARLLDYGSDGPEVVFVPSLINPPTILDLTESNSMLRWLARHGLHPLLVDWGTPGPEDKELTVTGHVEELLLPLIESRPAAVHLAGYCLGGTMAAAAAAPAEAKSLTLIAAPWNFSGFPRESRDALAEIWKAAEPAAKMLGALPMEVLQTAFWQLDPARTVSKFERFGRLDPESEAARAFVSLEDWANDGPPLTYGAARELVERFFCEDAPGRTSWEVAGHCPDPAALPCPVLDIVSATDRIVPAASAAQAGKTRSIAAGHVGMVIGRHARAHIWEPFAAWIRGVR